MLFRRRDGTQFTGEVLSADVELSTGKRILVVVQDVSERKRLEAQITLVRGLWLQGHADQALDLVEQMITESTAVEHTLTLAHILSDAACFIALWVGDLPLAARYTKMLREHTTLHALDVWREHKHEIELLLTDIVMPRMDGRELANQLVALRPNLKILYMSGYTDDVIVNRGTLTQGAKLVQKPFTKSTLLQKVRETLDAQVANPLTRK